MDQGMQVGRKTRQHDRPVQMGFGKAKLQTNPLAKPQNRCACSDLIFGSLFSWCICFIVLPGLGPP